MNNKTTEQNIHYDDFEIQPVREWTEPDGLSYCEPCDQGKESFWTLYGHLNTGGVEAIGDFRSREAAEETLNRIKGYFRYSQS